MTHDPRRSRDGGPPRDSRPPRSPQPSRDPFAEAADRGPIRFLHRLNPLSKIAGPLPAMMLLVVAHDLAVPLTLIALALLLLLVGARLSGRALLGLLVMLPLATAVLSVSLGLWTDASLVDTTPVLFQIGGFRVYAGSLVAGATTALRLAGILTLALLAGLTSTGPDLVRALVQQLHVPYRVGYTALAAYRFVPRFRHELDVIRQAHRVRGLATGRGPLAAGRHAFGAIVPLLAGGIRHAERVALAMDSRAFGASPARTERHLVPFRARDWVFMIAFWLATAALLVVTTVR